ncbi:hypothetical protein O9929_26310 [Vibrio lentus]|nr:hypothetical protein [Vibrio lentus]
MCGGPDRHAEARDLRCLILMSLMLHQRTCPDSTALVLMVTARSSMLCVLASELGSIASEIVVKLFIVSGIDLKL